MKRPRIVLADDHTLVLEGLYKILEDECDVVGMAEDGRTLLTMVQEHNPDVVVLDISMPQLNGLDAARQLHKLLPACKIIFLTMHADPTYAKKAFQVGASGYLLKRSAATELILAIHAVLKDQFYVTPVIAKEVLLPLCGGLERAPENKHSLTPRQREVLQLVAEGKAVKDIANILNVSSKTVEFHKTKIMRELNLHSTVELTKYAVAHGIVSSE
ncbi:MAG: response regulator transcription factor [Nitrospirota bacterium]|nr:response regulator transcription factor [Nitrospirota bacterium]MDH5585393.1 response regulator transcription factor [Nitrospirota bacterium]MDH5773759.1 response regulator transcription factor [Nitrospirota bacterium]